MKNEKTRTYNSIVRQKQAEETKNRIADAAEELVKANGYENTTIGAIAKKAGVATQTVYAIFNSKQGILIYILKRSLREIKLDFTFPESVNQESLAGIAKHVAELTTKHGQKQMSAMNSLGGFEILYPELSSLIEEASRYRRQSIEAGIRESMRVRNANLTETKMKILTDIMWAFTDNHLYYSLVVEAGWPLERFEILFQKIMQMVMLDLAPEMLQVMDD